ncbi:MAG: ADP-ribosylglycohydrolase family protein [Deltaproteobacteria bacterium]|jgi:ADP-ribosylglycohydrolase|nr:ADP-ribosylglycohydrolase family protein [Deltaproteobacteria bacterium]
MTEDEGLSRRAPDGRTGERIGRERRGLPREALERAQGALMGQLAGDALGSQVEFMGPGAIRESWPEGVTRILPGGVWGTLPGQPTDDSEMALALARDIVSEGSYSPRSALRAYGAWFRSGPFDCGNTVASALSGTPRPESQANGAMMRASPLGIAGAGLPLEEVALMAAEDAKLTHVNPVAVQANSLYAMAVARAVERGPEPRELYGLVAGWAQEAGVDGALMDAVEAAGSSKPASYTKRSGWVLIAFQNALYRLANSPSFEDGVSRTAEEGGDADTNCAICGALLGAVHGLKAVPDQWVRAVLTCFPREGPGVRRPRPAAYFPGDAMYLAASLIGVDLRR